MWYLSITGRIQILFLILGERMRYGVVSREQVWTFPCGRSPYLVVDTCGQTDRQTWLKIIPSCRVSMRAVILFYFTNTFLHEMHCHVFCFLNVQYLNLTKSGSDKISSTNPSWVCKSILIRFHLNHLTMWLFSSNRKLLFSHMWLGTDCFHWKVLVSF